MHQGSIAGEDEPQEQDSCHRSLLWAGSVKWLITGTAACRTMELWRGSLGANICPCVAFHDDNAIYTLSGYVYFKQI